MSPRAKTSEPDSPPTIPCRPAEEPINAEQAASLVEQRAEQLDERLFSAFLFATLDSSVKGIDPQIYKVHVERLLSQSGSPRDPVERMLVQQLILANQHCCLLTARSAKTATVAEAVMLSTAAARVLAEIRRTALALASYRQAAGGRSLSVVSGDCEQEDRAATSAG